MQPVQGCHAVASHPLTRTDGAAPSLIPVQKKSRLHDGEVVCAQGNDLFGKGKNAGVQVADLTDEVWGHIFLGKTAPTSSSIPSDILAAMRREFEFWYPWDLRVRPPHLRPALQHSVDTCCAST